MIPSLFHNKEVFITGHTGFKGAWLCEWLLALGSRVTGWSLADDVSTPSLYNQLHLSDRMRDLRGDLRDATALTRALLDAKPDFVFHMAAQPLVRLSYTRPLQTWETNVLGTIHILEALRQVENPCTAILITTDKVYDNREWLHAYREEDALGGYDPYSSSKGAAEIAISSWRRSFFQNHAVRIASARAGNVIGGGDWAKDRIVPDAIRALQAGEPVPVRNKTATRPWQHVLEPLSGYLTLATAIATHDPVITSTIEGATQHAASFNFGPDLSSNRTVAELVQEILRHWPGSWEDHSDPKAPHEASKLNLATDKAFHLLGWQPRWDFSHTIEHTTAWYKGTFEGADPITLTRQQIAAFEATSTPSHH